MSTQPTGTDPLVLKADLAKQIADNSISINQLWQADALAGLVNAWRIMFRFDAVDVAGGHWGDPNWGMYGDLSSAPGTSNLQEIAFFMARSRVSPNGKYEVQMLVGENWYSAASLIAGNPLVPNTVPGVPNIYMPGPPLTGR